jgi:hypothetical protein
MAVESKVEENGTVIEKGDLKLILDSPSAPLRNGTDNLILAWANESLEQLVEIRSRRFNEDPAVAPDRNGPVTPTVSPSLLRDPVHLAQLREGAC